MKRGTSQLWTEVLGSRLSRRASAGLITRRQLLDAGLSATAVSRSIAAGRLHPLHRGVCLVGHPVPPPLAREQAALLATGPTAALSHRTAAALWKRLPSPSDTVEVTVADRRCRPRPGLQPHANALSNKDTTTYHRLRITTPARTVHDLTGRGSRRLRLPRHATRRTFDRDRLRDADLAAAGYRVIRVTWRQLTEESEALVARLAAALARSLP